MKICSVTVWYNPDESNVGNILTYSSLCKKCYVVDNSEADNSALAAKIPNAVYISNGGNLGIAAALNKGCQMALDAGFEWCMTMDQDSSWDSEQAALYFSLCKDNAGEKNVSFCPSADYEMPRSFLGLAKRACLSCLGLKKSCDAAAGAGEERPQKTPMDCCITSGNVISLSAWKKIGGFYEPFFIDEVDHEFCFRLKEAGFEILKFENCKMNHVLGSPRRSFYPRVSHHANERLYYIFRNMLFESRLHPEYFKKLNYGKQLKARVKEIVFNFKFSQLYYLIKARSDFKKGRLGRFQKRGRS